MSRHFLPALTSLFGLATIGAQVPLATHTGAANADGFGGSIANVGDVDKDGVLDYAVAQSFERPPRCISNRPQALFVYSGKTHKLLKKIVQNETAWECGWGTRIAALGDSDGDGHGEYAVGGSRWASCEVRSGKTHARVVLHAGVRAFDSIGDVNGDGKADLLVVQPRSASAAKHYVRIYSGATKTVLREIESTQKSFGDAIASVGDLDGDKVQDFAIGSPGESKVFIHSGKSGKLLKTLSKTGKCRFGNVLDSVGDYDGDKTNDFVVSEANFFGCGSIVSTVYSGKTFLPLKKITGHLAAPYGRYGDHDGDGRDDLLLQNRVGSHLVVQVVSAKDDSVLHEISWLWHASIASVAVADDYDGDKRPEILVAEPHRAFLGYGFVYSSQKHTLSISTNEISSAAGGRAVFRMRAGAKYGPVGRYQRLYVLAGSWTGTSPGIPLDSHVLPLVPDFYMTYLVGTPNALILNNVGINQLRYSTAVMTLPKGAATSLVGRTMHHAFTILDLHPQRKELFMHASNPVTLKIVR